MFVNEILRLICGVSNTSRRQRREHARSLACARRMLTKRSRTKLKSRFFRDLNQCRRRRPRFLPPPLLKTASYCLNIRSHPLLRLRRSHPSVYTKGQPGNRRKVPRSLALLRKFLRHEALVEHIPSVLHHIPRRLHHILLPPIPRLLFLPFSSRRLLPFPSPLLLPFLNMFLLPTPPLPRH